MKTIYAVSEGKRFNSDTTLTVVSCASCHMLYAIPASLDSSAQAYPGGERNGWTLFCPLGHEWHYLGRSVEAERDEAKNLLARERANHAQTVASRNSYKAHLSRVRNEKARLVARVANGVCPCCNRTFKQLARHMVSQHHDFIDKQTEAST